MTPIERRIVDATRRSLYKNLKTLPLLGLSDEQLLEIGTKAYEEQVDDPQHQGAQAGGISETMGRATLRRLLKRWSHRDVDRKNKIEKKRDGCLSLTVLDVRVMLYWENKRVGTDLQQFKNGPLKGRLLAEVYTKRKGSSGQAAGANTYSIHHTAPPGVLSAHVITLNTFWFFAARDIARSDGTLYENCFIDVDTNEIFVTEGGPQRGKIVKKAMAFLEPDFACDRELMLKTFGSALTAEEIVSLPKPISLATSGTFVDFAAA